MRFLLTLVFAFSFIPGAASPPAESIDRLNQVFPDLVFYEPGGKPARLSDYRGRVVLVKLWGTWCGICQAKWPGHQRLYNQFKQHPDFEMITLSVFEDPRKSQQWVDAQGFDVPLFRNPISDRGAVPVADGSYFFIQGTPMTFLIDRDGILRQKAVGQQYPIGKSAINELL